MTMKQKRSDVPGKVPLVADLDDGQLAVNTHDAALFLRKTVAGTASVVQIGAEIGAAVAATLKAADLPAFRAAVGLGALSTVTPTGTAGAATYLRGDGSWSTPPVLGVSQVWQDMSAHRAADTVYQNDSDRPIQVALRLQNIAGRDFQVSPDGVTWLTVAAAGSVEAVTIAVTIPTGHSYRVLTGFTAGTWRELR